MNWILGRPKSRDKGSDLDDDDGDDHYYSDEDMERGGGGGGSGGGYGNDYMPNEHQSYLTSGTRRSSARGGQQRIRSAYESTSRCAYEGGRERERAPLISKQRV